MSFASVPFRVSSKVAYAARTVYASMAPASQAARSVAVPDGFVVSADVSGSSAIAAASVTRGSSGRAGQSLRKIARALAGARRVGGIAPRGVEAAARGAASVAVVAAAGFSATVAAVAGMAPAVVAAAAGVPAPTGVLAPAGVAALAGVLAPAGVAAAFAAVSSAALSDAAAPGAAAAL